MLDPLRGPECSGGKGWKPNGGKAGSATGVWLMVLAYPSYPNLIGWVVAHLVGLVCEKNVHGFPVCLNALNLWEFGWGALYLLLLLAISPTLVLCQGSSHLGTPERFGNAMVA